MSEDRPREPDSPVPNDAEKDPAQPSAAFESAPEGDVGLPSSLGEALETPPDEGAAAAFHQRARLAEDRLEEVLSAYRRLKGENEQFKERITRNIERRSNERRENLVLRFIDILDNLDRALEASERSYATESLIDGLLMVRAQLLQTLQDEGLERVPVLGLPFDPETGEAVETRPVDDPDHHHLVVGEMLRGYRFEGRLVRASRVIVGEHQGAETEGEAEAAASAPPEPAAEAATSEETESESSVEDIVARAQASEALFPAAFDEGEGDDEEEEVEVKDDEGA